LQRSAGRGHRLSCLCDCGNRTVVWASNLIRGKTKSCGCFMRETTATIGRSTKTHGQAAQETRTYTACRAAKARCENPKHRAYKDYGGRGVRFLFTSFEQFYAELGDPPPGMSLDRIDNNGHYEPGNVRWAAPREQQNNKRNNHQLTALGRTQTIADWARETGFSKITIRGRIKRGWPPERALTP
jgi:hypothetical protein